MWLRRPSIFRGIVNQMRVLFEWGIWGFFTLLYQVMVDNFSRYQSSLFSFKIVRITFFIEKFLVEFFVL